MRIFVGVLKIYVADPMHVCRHRRWHRLDMTMAISIKYSIGEDIWNSDFQFIQQTKPQYILIRSNRVTKQSVKKEFHVQISPSAFLCNA